MIPALLVSVTLMIAPEVSGEEMAQYQQARAVAGRDADAHVNLALWCEQHGMSGKRMEHLALALMADPANATARGLMGLMKDGKGWHRPDAVAERIAKDAEQAGALAEYNEHREKAKLTADSQWDLALWCEDRGLKAEAKAHLAAVVRLEPGRDAAWKRLGCKKHHGRWMTQEQIDAAIAEERAQGKADKVWGPKLARLKDDLKKASKKADAEREIAKIDAPRAVPTVWRLFALGSAADQARAVQIFAQTDAVAASQALAMLAVFGEADTVRRAATESLVWRDQREYLDGLVDLIHEPVKYKLMQAEGEGGEAKLYVEGEKYNLIRTYRQPELPVRSIDFVNRTKYQMMYQNQYNQRVSWNSRGTFSVGDQNQMVAAIQQGGANPAGALGALAQATNTPGRTVIPEAYKVPLDSYISAGIPFPYGAHPGPWIGVAGGYDERYAFPQVNNRLSSWLARSPMLAKSFFDIAEYQHSVLLQEQKLEQDEAYLEASNRFTEQRNALASNVLETLTGQHFGNDREDWMKWWAEAKGYGYRAATQKPTFQERVPLVYAPSYRSHSCFAKGTPVQTMEGLKPVETIQIGDRVLTQDVKTGELSYETVLTPVHNPPAETFRVDLGSETIVATGIHRFWKAGEGWAMVRDLKPGDRVRTVGGVATVQGVSAERTQPVFNLEVASGRNYFVGKTGFLVHDNSLIETVDQPFDAAPSLAAE